MDSGPDGTAQLGLLLTDGPLDQAAGTLFRNSMHLGRAADVESTWQLRSHQGRGDGGRGSMPSYIEILVV